MLGPTSMLAVKEDVAFLFVGSSHFFTASSYSPVQVCLWPPPPGRLPCYPSVLPAAVTEKAFKYLLINECMNECKGSKPSVCGPREKTRIDI